MPSHTHSPPYHSQYFKSSPSNIKVETNHNFWNSSVWTLQPLLQNTQYQPQTESERSAHISLWRGQTVSSSSCTCSTGIPYQPRCCWNESLMTTQLHFLLPVVPESRRKVDLLLSLERKTWDTKERQENAGKLLWERTRGWQASQASSHLTGMKIP